MQPNAGSGGYVFGPAAGAGHSRSAADAKNKGDPMRGNLLRASAVVFAVFAGTGLAFGQQPAPPADAQQKSQQEKAQQTPSGKSGTEEPSSHAPAAAPQNVLVNGALAVPGAPADTDTVPAKFSAKNAADDELITVAYTFKLLTDDERRAIYHGLVGEPAGAAFNAEVGDELPSDVALRAVPDAVAASAPQTRDYRYVVANDRVLLVGTSRIVAGVVRSEGPPASEGRRAQ
jgi:hypothetical protein